MSYIYGGNSVTSGDADDQPPELPKQGQRGRTTAGGEGQRSVPDLYPTADPASPPTSECRRITDPAPTPHAVKPAHRRSCIEQLASGRIEPGDLCPACTRTFMQALGAVVPNLDWHPNFVERAAGTRQGVSQ